MHSQPGKWEVNQVELDEPRQGELLIKVAACGLCHSDDHIATGDSPVPVLPLAGGHEGAGVVVRTGPNTPGWDEGDHVVLSFIPVCGRCRMCASGQQNLCDLGASVWRGSRPDDDDSFRMHLDGRPVGQLSCISALSEYTVADVRSVVKIPKDIPLNRACLVGCGVATGWGSVANLAGVGYGDVVIVMGVGGLGINAVQAASVIGASVVIAVDPVAFKRTTAMSLGATHAFSDINEAADFARSMTNGQGADAAVITIGVVTGDHVAAAFGAIRKGGTVVVTGLGDQAHARDGVKFDLVELPIYQKRLQGSLYGGCNPTLDIPVLLNLYRQGRLKLDELVTRTYTLEQVNQGYDDMRAGKIIRGVVEFA